MTDHDADTGVYEPDDVQDTRQHSISITGTAVILFALGAIIALLLLILGALHGIQGEIITDCLFGPRSRILCHVGTP
jgi:hypothetical protein